MNSKRVLIIGGSGFIGTNLIESLRSTELSIRNLDIAAPLSLVQEELWQELDFLDRPSLIDAINEFQPNFIIDLAARTDVVANATVENDYQKNIDGVANIIAAASTCRSVERVVFTSTQYVKRPGPLPTSDEDYDPHTVYGESKVRMERLIRQADPPFVWTIIRPTNVWGPWHLRYRAQFLKVLSKGWYFHPGSHQCIKSYAYVGNVVDQVSRILVAHVDEVNRKTLYVGDAPGMLLDWVNAFSNAISGKDVRVIPNRLVYLLAVFGDAISVITRKPFLITTSRYNSMVEDYLTPMERTFEALGPPRYQLEDGVRQTIEWLEKYDDAIARSR